MLLFNNSRIKHNTKFISNQTNKSTGTIWLPSKKKEERNKIEDRNTRKSQLEFILSLFYCSEALPIKAGSQYWAKTAYCMNAILSIPGSSLAPNIQKVLSNSLYRLRTWADRPI